MAAKPDPKNSESAKELDKAEKQFEAFDNQIKEMTLDRMNEAPKEDIEPQTKIAQADLAKQKAIYLKPKRTISSPEKFNEKFRSEYNYKKEYVCFIAENYEVIGEAIVMWTKQFPGIPAEEWSVPTNKVIWAPRYVAEQIKNCKYHQFTMQNTTRTAIDATGEMYGAMIVDNIKQRLNATPASEKRSIFMGAQSF